MSAALQLPIIWGAAAAQPIWPAPERSQERNPEQEALLPPELQLDFLEEPEESQGQDGPSASLAFYRKHTESLLRRYLYVSTQVGRTPSVMYEPIERGNASCRRVRTFEDAVIFVLDVETCLGKLSVLERALLSRIVLQEYTHTEAGAMLGMSVRAVNYKLRHALDRMTETLLDAGLLQFTY